MTDAQDVRVGVSIPELEVAAHVQQRQHVQCAVVVAVLAAGDRCLPQLVHEGLPVAAGSPKPNSELQEYSAAPLLRVLMYEPKVGA